jgi:hypothetical protein
MSQLHTKAVDRLMVLCTNRGHPPDRVDRWSAGWAKVLDNLTETQLKRCTIVVDAGAIFVSTGVFLTGPVDGVLKVSDLLK